MKIRLEVSSVASKYRSGVAQYTRLLSDALASSGEISLHDHYFDFLHRQPNPSLAVQPEQTESNTIVPLKVYAKAQSYNAAPAFDIFLPKVDLTIFPNFATWPTLHSRFSATVIHDLTYIYFPDVVEDKNLQHLRRVVPRSIKQANFIITVSESVKAELVKEFKLNPEKCIVTPIPPDESFFAEVPNEKLIEVRNKYGLDPNKKYIYFIGNLEPRKNLSTLIEAYRLLPSEIKEAHSLVLAGGTGWKVESTRRILQEAIDAGEDIKHLGFIDQEDSPALFQAASLFVMPSLYEGFGMPILEAMASGTPVVASDIPVLREVGGELATYANPNNPEEFKSAIVQTLTSPILHRKEFQQNVRRFSWNTNVQNIINKVHSLE